MTARPPPGQVWYVLEHLPGESPVNSSIRFNATSESEALRWAAGKYRLTADEIAKLAASRSVSLPRLGLVVWLRRIRTAEL